MSEAVVNKFTAYHGMIFAIAVLHFSVMFCVHVKSLNN